MTDADLLAEATAELYAADPVGFTERRTALAAQARAAGAAAAAREIAALRKPTHAAWLVNQLVRADPEVAPRLGELGGELRAAGAALDGARIRELSQARRQLIDSLVRQALQLSGGPPAAALREELTATFGAALADPQVADQLAAGTLVRAVHRADFTPAGPGLTLVPPPGTGRTPPRPRTATGQTVRQRADRDRERAERDRQRAAVAAERERQRAAQAELKRQAAQAERERQNAIAQAERAVSHAAQAAEAAAAAEREQLGTVEHIEEQLADARQRLTEARRRARQARDAERAARRALGRLHR